MQEKLADGMKTVQDAGQHLKDKALSTGHDINDATHRLLPGHKPTRRTRIKNRAKQSAPGAVGAAIVLVLTAFVRRSQRTSPPK